MSFLLDGQADVLAEFAKGLEKLKIVFQKFVPTGNDLSLRPEAPSTWTNKPLQCNPLPRRPKRDRKAQLEKRVGATPEGKLKEADITVAIKEETDNKTVIVEEVTQILWSNRPFFLDKPLYVTICPHFYFSISAFLSLTFFQPSHFFIFYDYRRHRRC